MKRNTVETILGAVILVIAAVFLFCSYNAANIRKVDGYEIYADFSATGGLIVGDVVQISGVKVGNVTKINLDPDTFLARVYMSVAPYIQLPDDTAALISSEGLMGGRYLALEPGASDEYLSAGGRIQFTQAPQNLEQLLGQFIFSMSNKDEEKSGSDKK
jgi:phospholipid/cholesterol/gamma-HCH transport system substrate-binding protein